MYASLPSRRVEPQDRQTYYLCNPCGLDVLGQSPRHNICAFIELSCYLNCFIKITYIMLNKYSDSIICVVPVFETVESNFTTYTRCQLKTNENYHSIHHIRYTRFLAEF